MKDGMFRSFFAVACCLLFLVSIIACGSKDHALSLEKDMGISIEGTWYPILKEASPLLTALGEDPQITSFPSCVFEGEDREFRFKNCLVFTNPDGEKDIWYNILLLDDSLATARGIRVGDSLEKVKEAYGEKFYWEGETILVYSISGKQGDMENPCILFTIEDNLVIEIEIYDPANAT